MFDQHIG